ncbi:MAG: alpha/beta hydrolase, partial [Halobacteriales archaeon]|nr:alpha/beta hydrolase [Halobacteriales archaeon]
RLLDHVGIARCHVAAVSLGTFVLAELLHAQPERFDRVALVGMPVVRRVFMEVDDYAQGAEPAIVAEVTQGTAQRLGPMQQMLVGVLPRKMISRRFRDERPEQFRATLKRMLELNPTDLWIGMQQFYGLFGHDWRRLRVYEALPADRRLFLAGETDAVTPLHDLRAHPSTGRGPTVVLRGTGHLGFYEYPEVAGPILRHFLEHGALPAELPGRGMAERLEAAA